MRHMRRCNIRKDLFKTSRFTFFIVVYPKLAVSVYLPGTPSVLKVSRINRTHSYMYSIHSSLFIAPSFGFYVSLVAFTALQEKRYVGLTLIMLSSFFVPKD